MGEGWDVKHRELPKGWRWHKLGEIAEVSGGLTFDKEWIQMEPREDSCLVLRGGNIQAGRIVQTEDPLFIPRHLVSPEQTLRKGDVLVVISTGSHRLVGKVGIVREDSPRTSFGAFLCRIRPNQEIEPRYFGCYFLTEAYRHRINVLAQGSSINNLRKSQLEEMPFPLPPHHAQVAIADRLEPLLGQMEKARELVHEGLSLLEQSRAALLEQALYSETWPMVSLGSIIRLKVGDPLPQSRMNPLGGIPVYGGNGIRGYHDRWNCNEKTVVIGRVGSRCGSVHVTPEKAWVTDNAFWVEYDRSRLDGDYLAQVLTACDLRRYASSSAQPVISGKTVYPLTVPLPPLSEQRRLAERLRYVTRSLEEGAQLLTEANVDQVEQQVIEHIFWGHNVSSI